MEARRTIQAKFQPRTEADAIRKFAGWAAKERKLTKTEHDATVKTIAMFEGHVRNDLAQLSPTLDGLRNKSGVEVFALDDKQLALSVDIGFSCDLQPFDQSVLAAILGRADDIRADETDAVFAFCELDGDLQPWDRHGRGKPELTDFYAPRGIWVYGDFDMVTPPRPPHWPYM